MSTPSSIATTTTITTATASVSGRRRTVKVIRGKATKEKTTPHKLEDPEGATCLRCGGGESAPKPKPDGTPGAARSSNALYKDVDMSKSRSYRRVLRVPCARAVAKLEAMTPEERAVHLKPVSSRLRQPPSLAFLKRLATWAVDDDTDYIAHSNCTSSLKTWLIKLLGEADLFPDVGGRRTPGTKRPPRPTTTAEVPVMPVQAELPVAAPTKRVRVPVREPVAPALLPAVRDDIGAQAPVAVPVPIPFPVDTPVDTAPLLDVAFPTLAPDASVNTPSDSEDSPSYCSEDDDDRASIAFTADTLDFDPTAPQQPFYQRNAAEVFYGSGDDGFGLGPATLAC